MTKTTTTQTTTTAENLQAARLFADKSLDLLSPWEPGQYQALDAQGDLIGYVNCTAAVAALVNRMICDRQEDERRAAIRVECGLPVPFGC